MNLLIFSGDIRPLRRVSILLVIFNALKEILVMLQISIYQIISQITGIILPKTTFLDSAERGQWGIM